MIYWHFEGDIDNLHFFNHSSKLERYFLNWFSITLNLEDEHIEDKSSANKVELPRYFKVKINNQLKILNPINQVILKLLKVLTCIWDHHAILYQKLLQYQRKITQFFFFWLKDSIDFWQIARILSFVCPFAQKPDCSLTICVLVSDVYELFQEWIVHTDVLDNLSKKLFDNWVDFSFHCLF